MRDALLTAAGACLVAGLNEVRAQLRARQADRDRREALIAAALLVRGAPPMPEDESP